MYKINDNVIHKSAGACYVKDITTSDFGNGPQSYYLLKPKFPTNVNKTLEIFLPIEKESLFLRDPITSSDVLNLIRIVPSMEDLWIQDAKARKQKFEEIYHKGDIKGLCALVKLLYMNSPLLNKPMSITDKTFLTRIKVNIFDEFAIALNLQPDEIEEFIAQRLRDKEF